MAVESKKTAQIEYARGVISGIQDYGPNGGRMFILISDFYAKKWYDEIPGTMVLNMMEHPLIEPGRKIKIIIEVEK